MSRDWNAFLVDEELREVPLDSIHEESSLLCLQEIVKRNGIIAVYVDLLKDIPFDVVLLDEFLDVDGTSWLLIHELTAREAQDPQSLILVLRVQLIQLLVIAFSESTLRSHVHDDQRMSSNFSGNVTKCKQGKSMSHL